jgi:hypothetical protein
VELVDAALDAEVSFRAVVADCIMIEARGFESQAPIARALWRDELPSGTDTERSIAAIVRLYEGDGLDGSRARLTESPAYRAACRAS